MYTNIHKYGECICINDNDSSNNNNAIALYMINIDDRIIICVICLDMMIVMLSLQLCLI